MPAIVDIVDESSVQERRRDIFKASLLRREGTTKEEEEKEKRTHVVGPFRFEISIFIRRDCRVLVALILTILDDCCSLDLGDDVPRQNVKRTPGFRSPHL